jgi:hypothetical protein
MTEVLPPFSTPVLTTVGGTQLVLAVFAVTVPSDGQVDHRAAAELLAVDARTGHVAWSLRLYQPDALGSKPAPQLLGVDGSTAVVATDTTVYGIDLLSRRTQWTRTGFEAQLLIDHRVVGAEPPSPFDPNQKLPLQRLTALTAANGVTAWSTNADRYQIYAQQAGPHLIAVNDTDQESADKYFSVFRETADGRALHKPAPIPDRGPFDCWYDQVAVTVCSVPKEAVGYDAVSGKQLWRLRDAPVITTVWRGTVYGNTRGQRPVALDARSGKKLPGPTGAAPFTVNAYVGLVIQGNRVVVHPTTG